jgi:hypothetical protein
MPPVSCCGRGCTHNVKIYHLLKQQLPSHVNSLPNCNVCSVKIAFRCAAHCASLGIETRFVCSRDHNRATTIASF